MADSVLVIHCFKAEMNYDLDGLMELLRDPSQRPNYEWIRGRVRQMWPNWVKAGQRLSHVYNMTHRPQKRVRL